MTIETVSKEEMTIDQSQEDHAIVDDAIGAGVAPAGAHSTDIDRCASSTATTEARRARAGC